MYIYFSGLIVVVMIFSALERLLFSSLSPEGQELGYWEGVQGEAHSQGIIIFIFAGMFIIYAYLKRKSILSRLMKSKKVDKEYFEG